MSLADDLAATDARMRQKRPGAMDVLREQMERLDAEAVSAKADADAARTALEHSERLRIQAETQLATERSARQSAENAAIADQRARVEAEGETAKQRARADGLQAQLDAAKAQKPAAAPQPAAVQQKPPAPVAYTHEVSRGGDGLIKSITSRPL